MSDDTKGYRIVVGVDFTEGSQDAVRDALRIGTRLAGAELHFATVLENRHLERAKEMEKGRVQLMYNERKLVAFVRDIADSMRLAPATLSLVFHVRIGDVVEALTQVAYDVDAQLVIVGATHKPRAVTMLLGSVAQRLLAEARFPLLVARPRRIDGLVRTPRPDPRRPGEDLHSPRENVLQSAERVDFGLPRSHISGLF